jgi:hypothetical protein
MDPLRLITKLTTKEPEQTFIPRTSNASLDDLYAAGCLLGEVKLGMTFDPHGVEIHLHDHKVNGDYIWIRSKIFPTAKENLAACIDRATKVVRFYQSI